MKPDLDDLKAEAKRLRAALAESGRPASHGEALEILARSKGYRNWNTLHAAAGNRPPEPPLAVGQTVSGAYLGHRFRAEVIAVAARRDGGFRVTVVFDEPLNVSAFESMRIERRRVSANIRSDGKTVERIAGGVPQMAIDL